MTVREVFDFEVGDEFHYLVTDQPDATPPSTKTRYIRDIVIGKVSLLDTLIYTFKRKEKIVYSFPIPNTIDSFVFYQEYFSLDSTVRSAPVPFYPFGILVFCPHIWCYDSSYLAIDFFNKRANYFKANGLIWGETRVIKGLGIEYFFQTPERQKYLTISLKYYKSTVKNEEWGTKLNLVGLNNLEENKVVNLTPNPFSNKLQLQTEPRKASDSWEIKAFNSLGAVVYIKKIEPTEDAFILPELSFGLYHFLILQNGSEVYRKSLIKNQ